LQSDQHNNLRLGLETIVTLTAFGFTPVLIKFVSANPFTIGIVRLLITVAFTGTFLVSFRELKALKKKHIRNLAIMGLLFAIHWITYFYSIKFGSASIAFLGLCTFGVHLIIMGWIMKLRKPMWNDFAAVILVIIGSLMVTPEFDISNDQTLGLLLAIISAVFFAALPIFQQKNADLSNTTRAFGQYSFATLVFLFTLPLSEWESLTANDWWGMIALGVLCTFVAHTLWIKVTTQLPTTISSIIYYLTLPLAMLISYIFLGEGIGMQKISGAMFIIGANIISLLPKLKQHRKAKALNKMEKVEA